MMSMTKKVADRMKTAFRPFLRVSPSIQSAALVCCALSAPASSLLGQSTGVWTRLTPAHSPPACAADYTAYDNLRDRVVLIGGATAADRPHAGAWEFDGQDWLQIAPPNTVHGTALWWDEQRGQLIGLEYIEGSSPHCDIHGWSGFNPAAFVVSNAAHVVEGSQ